MSLEIRPHGTECNLNCKYCYQQHYRESRNFNFEDFKPKLHKAFTLFGGDPLV
jgi:sulfatase maturation enzyme AslB (radical SAM superfamily)